MTIEDTTPGEVEVRLGRLTGRIPFAVSVSDLRVGDATGEWLVIEALAYQVEPAALLRSILRFRLLEVEGVRLDRLPQPAASEPEETEAFLKGMLERDIRPGFEAMNRALKEKAEQSAG